jgi:hypothetical protein
MLSILDAESHSSIFELNPIRMKRRIRKIVNFFAFNLLFFALYLNFIHKDKSITLPVAVQTNTPAITGTVPVHDAEKYLNAKTAASVTEPVEKSELETANKLSIN